MCPERRWLEKMKVTVISWLSGPGALGDPKDTWSAWLTTVLTQPVSLTSPTWSLSGLKTRADMRLNPVGPDHERKCTGGYILCPTGGRVTWPPSVHTLLIPDKQAHFHRSFPTLARARLGSGAPVSRCPEPIFPDFFLPGQQYSPEIDDVDDQQGSFQMRANKLLDKILRLRSLDAWPISEVADTSPSTADPTVSLPASLLHLCGPSRLYFVGIQTLTAARTFCQQREFSDPFALDGGIFLRLQNAGGPVARALGFIADRAAYFVGISDYPVGIESNYASHQHNFREINSLLELENSHHADDLFFPGLPIIFLPPLYILRRRIADVQ
ncbi:hypothetical protein B0H10DRAFT_2329182 [Mycena sp. CBHHK59/15]|nr:hypothetical protein B0H10DRAFT_2329182 [Mycena sp. CBHHK59/15]